MRINKGWLVVAALAMLVSQAFAVETGPPNSVLRVPPGGGRPRFGAVDLSNSSAVANQLGQANGGTGATTANGAAAALLAQPADNQLYNADLFFWQRGTTFTVSTGSTAYGPDRWYAKNSLGGSGTLTFSQVAGTQSGSKYAAKLVVGVAGSSNGTELYQTLENADTLPLMGQTASMSVWVKSFGNVNQVGLQFMYKTTEAKVDTGIGSETTCTVNSTTFTQCTINGQALGTAMTTSGSIGVRVRTTGVSTGNLWDSGNGFSVEQPMMNVGASPATFKRRSKTTGAELTALQRYYEVLLGNVAGEMVGAGYFSDTTHCFAVYYFKVPKRAQPVVNVVGGTGFVCNNSSNNYAASSTTVPTISTASIQIQVTTAIAGTANANQVMTSNATTSFVTVDAEI